MFRPGSRTFMGATLLVAPHVHGGIQKSGIVSILLVVGVALIGLLVFRGSRPGPSNPGGGWRKGPPPPDSPGPEDPCGGIPLDEAVPARVRLRGEARLADLLPKRSRRPAREPERAPVRTPHV